MRVTKTTAQSKEIVAVLLGNNEGFYFLNEEKEVKLLHLKGGGITIEDTYFPNLVDTLHHFNGREPVYRGEAITLEF